jgi:hypothetical protein
MEILNSLPVSRRTPLPTRLDDFALRDAEKSAGPSAFLFAWEPDV